MPLNMDVDIIADDGVPEGIIHAEDNFGKLVTEIQYASALKHILSTVTTPDSLITTWRVSPTTARRLVAVVMWNITDPIYPTTGSA